jgi:hypothetical protein
LYKSVKANQSGAGVDGQSIEGVEEDLSRTVEIYIKPGNLFSSSHILE